ncbi:GATA transcription factor 26-like isoform X1 [Tasmannia lanceolata]|uniref:GATA transcription factor 26-like isoform X1 n=1 Tax=Tasmannia lanceolata TaxID=3420 RepID=UPI004064C12D
MGKEGPCCHCGITYTPLWRNGPPGKPVLCNACGSRWRTKGSLTNYTPLHSRGFPPIDSEDFKTSQEYKPSSKTKPRIQSCGFPTIDSEDFKNSQEHKPSSKTKPISSTIITQKDDKIEPGETVPEYDPFTTSFEEDTSNRSSSESASSFSESSVQLESMDGNDLSGSAPSYSWDVHIPSRKRTRNKRCSPSPVEKLRRDLYDILQEQESSNLSGPSEDVLLFERDDPMVSVEIGLGSVLIKHPNSSTEEESEASSFSCLSDPYMGLSLVHGRSQSNGISTNLGGKSGIIQDIGEMEGLKEHPAKRRALTIKSSEKTPLSNFDVRRRSCSPQRSIDLTPIDDEVFKLEKEMSSCSSHIAEVGISLPTERPQGQPFSQTSGGAKGSVKAQNNDNRNHHLVRASSGTN